MVWCGRSSLKAFWEGVLSCGGSLANSFVSGGVRMSQNGAVATNGVMLEELSSWPEEICRRELPSVLPRLLISLEGAEGGVSRAFWWFPGHGRSVAGTRTLLY